MKPELLKFKCFLSCIPFILYCISTKGQTNLDCGGVFDDALPLSINCTQTSSTFNNFYKLQASYIPGVSPYVDELVIPFNLIILTDDNGNQGAYTESQWANENQTNLMGWLNKAYESTSLPTDPVPGFPSNYWLSATKIRFEINEVYFYNNTTWFNQPYPTGTNNLRSHHLTANPEANDFVNCYIVKNSYPNAGGATWTSSSEPRIISVGWDDPAIPGTWSGDYWYWEHHLPHEMGHLLGLYHTYGGSSCCPEQSSGDDLLTDVFFNPFQYENTCPPGGPSVSPTDFCTNNVLSGHNEDNNFLSPLQAGRGHRMLRRGSTRHFAYGFSTVPHSITSNETWDFAYKSYNDIIVKAGSILTVTCNLEMVKESKIVVEPNAKLIVDGGIITIARSPGDDNLGRWAGIYVTGNSTASQTVNPQLFGRVELKNGAMIAHARSALNNFGLTPNGDVDWNTTGGIIEVENTSFLNNWMSAEFRSYQNTNSGGLPIDDKSYFRECDFTIDDDFIDNGLFNGAHLYAHISMSSTDGVNVHGCNFSNTQTADEADRGIGILSLGSEYLVREQCTGTTYPCPSGQQIPNTFSGLRYGIHATGYGNGNAITSVSNTTFSDNVHGIYAGSLDELNVHDNTFNVNGSNGPVGIYLEQTPNTDIYQNSFTTADISTLPNGITAKNLGYTANAIYNNSFNGLFVGSGAIGNNKHKSLGLEFLCNDYTNNFAGIVANVHNPQIGAQGIAKNQGAKYDAAGNTFSGNTWYDIYNADENLVYWYHSVQSTNDPLYPSLVTTATVTRSDALVTYPNDDCSLGGGSSNKMAAYNDKTQEVELKQTELEAIEDGGDTEGTLTAVVLTGVGEEYDLRNELLLRSPNVSEEVLKATIEKPAPLPNAMLRDVLAANPQAGKDREVMEALEMLSQPMTEDMKSQIKSAAQDVSPKEAKESEVAMSMMTKEKLANEIAVELLHDEVQYDPETARVFLEAKDDLSADMLLIKAYTNEKNIVGIDATWERIETRTEDVEYVASKFDDYTEFMMLQKQLILDDKG
jgi:hypothetical protein